MPTGVLSGALSRKAKPRTSARSSGNPKTQKMASVSRRNSFVRARASSMIGGPTGRSVVTQLSPGQRDEQVFERRLVRRQRQELRPIPLDYVDHARHGLGQRIDAQLPRLAVLGDAVAARQLGARRRRQLRLAGELDDVARLELGDEIRRRAEGDEMPVVDDGDTVAEALRL